MPTEFSSEARRIDDLRTMSLNLFKSLLIFLLLSAPFASAKPLKKEIIGTWEITGANVELPLTEGKIEFFKNKKGTLAIAGESGTFHWKLKGKKLTVATPDNETEIAFELDLSANQLTITFEDEQEFYATKVKE